MNIQHVPLLTGSLYPPPRVAAAVAAAGSLWQQRPLAEGAVVVLVQVPELKTPGVEDMAARDRVHQVVRTDGI